MPTAYIHDVDDVRGPDGPLSNQSNFDSDSEERKVTPVSSSIELVDFGTPDQPRELRIGTSLSPYERSRLIDLLRSYLDVFAWSYKDMLGLDSSIVQHYLPTLPHARPSATTIFHDMMHRDVEQPYRDSLRGSIQVKIESQEVHLWVTSRKLLGHIVSEHGIEVDLKKIRAILDMPAPKTEREIRGFLGILQYISYFIAKLTNICEPIFRLLKKSQPTIWDDDCHHAFEKIKELSDIAMGCMLAQLDDLGKERAIYYLSKRMLKYECRYIMIERLCLALVWATRRLRHYVTKYSILLVSRLDPLRYLFNRPILTSRLTRWLVLLTEFDIQYVTQKLVKGSIVANHLVLCRCLEIVLDLELDNWKSTGFQLGYYSADSGIWRTRDEKLKPYHAYFDLLVDVSSGMTVRPLLIEIRMDYHGQVISGLPWMHIVVISFRGAQSIDIIGKILLKSSKGGHEYILVAIDYFTKWVETASRRLTTTKKLLFALWAYRTMATPYSLVYGMEAVLLVEIKMGSLRVALE
ncbi:hypothetical protein AAG906_027996 [Vitis piasezkii]